MPVTGDFALAANLAKKLAALPQVKADIFRVAGAAALKQLSDEFNHSRNPYGEAWKPLRHPSKRRGGSSAKILVDRAILRNSYSAQPTADGFEISTRTEYAGAHQYGAHIAPHSRVNPTTVRRNSKTNRFVKASAALTHNGKLKKNIVEFSFHQTLADGIAIPRRQMVPEPDTGGVGERWGTAINKAADQVMRAAMAVK